MPEDIPTGVVEQHERQHGRTLIELHQDRDGTWTATQHEVDVVGTGETAALAAMDYADASLRASMPLSDPPVGRFRCHACEYCFEAWAVRPSTCPRCSAIGDHELLPARRVRG